MWNMSFDISMNRFKLRTTSRWNSRRDWGQRQGAHEDHQYADEDRLFSITAPQDALQDSQVSYCAIQHILTRRYF
jgi:hypothetical protein